MAWYCQFSWFHQVPRYLIWDRVCFFLFKSQILESSVNFYFQLLLCISSPQTLTVNEIIAALIKTVNYRNILITASVINMSVIHTCCGNWKNSLQLETKPWEEPQCGVISWKTQECLSQFPAHELLAIPRPTAGVCCQVWLDFGNEWIPARWLMQEVAEQCVCINPRQPFWSTAVSWDLGLMLCSLGSKLLWLLSAAGTATPGVVLCIGSAVVTFPYFPNRLPALNPCWPLIFYSSNCAFEFLLSPFRHRSRSNFSSLCWAVMWGPLLHKPLLWAVSVGSVCPCSHVLYLHSCSMGERAPIPFGMGMGAAPLWHRAGDHVWVPVGLHWQNKADVVF